MDYYQELLKLKGQLANVIRYGIIKEVDLANNLVVVDFSDSTYSSKLPYLVNGSGNAKVYFTPKEGDQAMVLSPNGSTENGGVCMPLIYKEKVEGSNDEWRLEFAKGSIKYKEGKLIINSDTEVDIITKTANIKADKVILSDETGGGVVCQNHTCSFTGGPHPIGSSKVKGSM